MIITESNVRSMVRLLGETAVLAGGHAEKNVIWWMGLVLLSMLMLGSGHWVVRLSQTRLRSLLAS